MTAAELRRKVEGLALENEDWRDDGLGRAVPHGSPVVDRSAVLALIPEEGVWVSEATLAEALHKETCALRTLGTRQCKFWEPHKRTAVAILARLSSGGEPAG